MKVRCGQKKGLTSKSILRTTVESSKSFNYAKRRRKSKTTSSAHLHDPKQIASLETFCKQSVKIHTAEDAPKEEALVPSIADVHQGDHPECASLPQESELCSRAIVETNGDWDQEKEEEKEEEEEFISISFNDPAIEEGDLVWAKYRHYTYYPALVKQLPPSNGKKKKKKTAVVVFLSKDMRDCKKKMYSFRVQWDKVKAFNCPEMKELIVVATNYDPDVKLFIELANNFYNQVLSSKMTFLEYCASEKSSLVWYCHVLCENQTTPISSASECETQENGQQTEEDTALGETSSDVGPKLHRSRIPRRLLPDRQKAARNRYNKELLQQVLQKHVADSHLRDVLTGCKFSRFLRTYKEHNASYRSVYLEDEGQVKELVLYIKKLYQELVDTSPPHSSLVYVNVAEEMQFFIDVLLPEALVCAFICLENISRSEAEKKFIQGPKQSRRFYEEFRIGMLDLLKDAHHTT
uniref:PWWP domain-containing DNA repair factor 3A-like n=1 Tax=Myxine glutinosa TaxID=7769 RepID=UPI00358F6BE5